MPHTPANPKSSCRRNFFFLLLPFVVMLSGAEASFAQGTFNSNAPFGANWNLASSWTLIAGADGDGIPDADDDVFILTGHTMNVNVASGCNNSTVNTGGNLRFTAIATLNVAGNLTMNGTAVVSTSAASNARILNVSGIFNVGAAATANIQGIRVNITGATALNGGLTFTSGIGVKTFTGLVTVNPGGSWTSTAITTTANLVFQNGIVSNGTSFSGSDATFNTNPQSISGATSVSFSDNVSITGVVVTNSITSPASLTVGDDLNGTGGLTQAVGALLNIGDDANIATLTATAVPNTVNYNGIDPGADIKCATYYHLSISKTGGGNAQFICSTTINGNLTINSGTLLSDNGTTYTHTVLGSTFILAGPPGGIYSINTNASVLNVQDLTMNGGTITAGGGTVAVSVATTFLATGAASVIAAGGVTVTGAATINAPLTLGSNTGVKTFSSLVTVNPTGSWTSTAITTTPNLIFQASVISNGTLFSASDATFNTASQTLSGATPVNFWTTGSPDVTVSGAITVTNQITTFVNIDGDLNGTAAGSTWRNAPSTRLNYAGTPAPMATGVLDASALGNVVNYDRGGGQSIRVPLSTDYYHLEITVSGTKTFLGSTDVLGTLILSGSAQANSGAFTHNVTLTTYVSGTANLNLNSATGIYNLTNLELTTTGGTNVGNSAGTPGTTNVSGTFLVNAGTSFVERCNFNVTGASTVNGSITLDDIPGDVKTFIGGVTVNAGGAWTSTGITPTTGLVFRNGIISNGTSFSAGGATFNTNAQSVNGATALGFANTVTVTGVIVTNNTTVNMSNVSAGTLTGTGTWTQGFFGTFLNYAGSTITIAALNASASANTVNYNRADGGAQTIFNPSASQYWHLTSSNTGTKTLSSLADVDGNLSIQGTAVLDVATNDILLAGNWDNSSTDPDPFIEGTRLVTFNGTVLQNINNTGDANGTVFNSMSINNSTPYEAVRLNAASNFNGMLTLADGHITTTLANIITGGPVASVTLGGSPQDSSFVKGPMNHTVDVSTSVTKVFPIGKGNNYRRLDLTIDQTPVTTTTYTAEMIPGSAMGLGYTLPAALTHLSYIRYYEITQSPSTGLDNAQLRSYFQCTQNDDVVEELPTLSIAQWDGGTAWLNRGGMAAGGICGGLSFAGDVLSSPFTTFTGNKFALGNDVGGTNPLPVELLSFDAKPNGNIVDVDWSTASELNSDYFVVQRSLAPSPSGEGWGEVGIVNAAGNSSTTKNYSSADYEPYHGTSYYRLKQVDNDGQFAFSNMVMVNFESDDMLAVYPNPSGKGEPFNVSIKASAGEEVLIVVRDLLGREFYSKVIIMSNEKEVFAIDPSGNIAAGVYLVVATSNAHIYEKKIVIR